MSLAEICELKYNLSDDGIVNKYLGVKVVKLADGSTKLSQPQIIRHILKDLGFNVLTIP